MPVATPPRARLLVELPPDRYKTLTPESRVPRIGDLLDVDHMSTAADGLQMILAYLPGPAGGDLYEAKAYESELEAEVGVWR